MGRWDETEFIFRSKYEQPSHRLKTILRGYGCAFEHSQLEATAKTSAAKLKEGRPYDDCSYRLFNSAGKKDLTVVGLTMTRRRK